MQISNLRIKKLFILFLIIQMTACSWTNDPSPVSPSAMAPQKMHLKKNRVKKSPEPASTIPSDIPIMNLMG